MHRDSTSRRARHARLFATILIAGFNNATLAAGRLLLPLVALSLGASTLLVGVISSLFTALPMVLSVRFGRWVDRAGALIPLVFASLLIVAASLLFLVVPSKQSLPFIAGLIGAGAVFSHVAATRSVAKGWSEESERTRNIGYLVASYSFFQFVGPMAAGASFEHFGARVAFLAIGALPVLALIGIGFGFHDFERESNATPQRMIRRSALELLGFSELRRWLVANSVFAAAQTLYPFIVSLHAAEIGLSAVQAGSELGAFAIGMLISRACVAVITKFFAPRTILIVALTSGALIYAVVPLLRDAYQLIALSGLLGLALGLGVPVALALVYRTAPKERTNESVGLSMAMANFLQMIAPLTLGFVASGLGVRQMIWSVSLTMLAVAAMGGAGSKGK